MGATASNARKTPGDNKRGNVDNASRLSRLKGGKSQATSADWSKADPRWLAATVAGICRIGGACLFGYSRDGGAYLLTVYLDGNQEKLWFNGDADLDLELQKVYTQLDLETP